MAIIIYIQKLLLIKMTMKTVVVHDVMGLNDSTIISAKHNR